MWLINGPFDCVQLGDEETLKTKLLKTNRVYGVGRHQDSPLCINSKKISRQHGQFIVEEHSEDDVSNGALVPSLSLRNNKTTALKITRGENVLLVNPDTTHQLESGDVVRLTGSISATVTWEPVVCFHPQSDSLDVVDLAACASLGIKLVTKHSRDVTHHVTSSLSLPLTSAMLFSLLTLTRFVTPDWLLHFIRLGSDNDQGLEKTYNPPLENEFSPEIDDALSQRYPTMVTKVAWSPNGGRKALFEDMRFVFVLLGSGAGTESKLMADVVIKGGATRQFIDIEKEAEEYAKGWSGTWLTVLKKGKVTHKEGMRSGLVFVSEEQLMTARDVPKDVRNAWMNMVDEAKSVNMRIIHPSLISEAIFKADATILDCVFEKGTHNSQETSTLKPLPAHMPSIQPEEPSESVPPATQSQASGAGPSRRLTRRATSQTPAQELASPAVSMEIEEESAAPVPPRKVLKRRAKTANSGGLVNELLGIEESTVLDALPIESQSQPPSVLPMPLPDAVPQTPARPGRLKRRAGTSTTAASQLFPDLSALREGEEPPLKKFKALFEQSGQIDADSQLLTLREEEEESPQSQALGQVQGRKRKAAIRGDVDADAALEDVEAAVAPKRRAIEALDSIEPSQQHKPPSLRKPNSEAAKPVHVEKAQKADKAKGAAPGKPDTDPSFLRAISTKRGKKTEDAFDREFNKLRIARPDINNIRDAFADNNVPSGKEWEGFDEFEKDAGIRGNFMQVVEMDVWRDLQQPGRLRRNLRREEGLGARLDWDGREDFKKFRRKMNVQPRIPVELVASESQDCAGGPVNWDSKGDRKPRGFDDISQSQENDSSQLTLTQTQNKYRSKPQSKPRPQAKAETEITEDQDDDEVEQAIGNVSSKKKGSAPQAGKMHALFNPGSDEEDVYVDVGGTLRDDEDLDMPLQSDKGQKRKTRGAKRKAVVPEESESDDGMNFKGFAKRAKKQKQ